MKMHDPVIRFLSVLQPKTDYGVINGECFLKIDSKIDICWQSLYMKIEQFNEGFVHSGDGFLYS